MISRPQQARHHHITTPGCTHLYDLQRVQPPLEAVFIVLSFLYLLLLPANRSQSRPLYESRKTQRRDSAFWDVSIKDAVDYSY